MVVAMVTMEAGFTWTSGSPHRLSAEKPGKSATVVSGIPPKPGRGPPKPSPPLMPEPDKPAPPLEPCPLADALFNAIGEQLDSGEPERRLFSDLADKLWTGSYLKPSVAGMVSHPYASKARLERLLNKPTEIRQRYQMRLNSSGVIRDIDFKRSLAETETAKLHNAWMNDVREWMSLDCLQ